MWKRDRALVLGYERPDAWKALDTINCPTLLVRGADSTLLTHDVALRMRARISNCQLVELTNAGHWCYDENLKEFENALLEFLGKA